jgi:anti-sigma regulatory factor (Ser/Thr protein kinase)
VHGRAGRVETVAAAEAHLALFYRDSEEYLGAISSFVAPALAAGEAVAIAVPGPRKLNLVREALDDDATEIELLDMAELGRNPARIISSVQGMIDRRGGPLHYVGEPIWPGRSPEEIREATRHEALTNLAWPGARIRALCPYDASALDAYVLDDAERTHPGVIRDGEPSDSPRYRGSAVPDRCETRLPDPPGDAAELRFGPRDLGQVRRAIADRAADAGLGQERVDDLVTAVNELAANTIRHARGHGRVWVWSPAGEVICQVVDPGHITDPLVGRRQPGPAADGGMGLWVVNQLCDLVELRTTVEGTAVRVHVNATPAVA